MWNRAQHDWTRGYNTALTRFIPSSSLSIPLPPPLPLLLPAGSSKYYLVSGQTIVAEGPTTERINVSPIVAL